MIDLGALKMSIFVDKEKAQNDLTDFGNSTKSLGGELKSFIGGAGKAAVTGIAAVGTAAVGAAASVYKMATDAATTVDRIDKLSAKIGLSKEGFQEWDYILGQNGASIEGLQMGLKTLVSQMDSAASGTASAQETFQKLGLTWEDGNGKLKDQETMMNEVLFSLASMENGTEKARLATELFGRSGSELMPMLNNGAEGMEELREQAHNLGLIMSDETVNAGVHLGDTIDDVKKSFSAVVTKIGGEVMPVIQSLLDWLLQYMPQIQAVLSVVFTFVGEFVGKVIDWLQNLIGTVKDWASNNQESVERIKSFFEDLWQFLGGVIQLIVDIIKEFCGICKGLWEQYGEDLMKILGPVWEGLKTIVNTVLEHIRNLLSVFKHLFTGDWKGLWEDIKNIFTNIWDGIVNLVPRLLDGIINVFKLSFDGFKNAGKAMFGAVWEGLKEIWNSICSWVTDKVNWLVDKLAFWRKGKDEVDTDGSHRTGLREVPYDGYIAELHKGEMVLTASEAQRYPAQNEKQTTYNVSVVNNSPKALTEKESAKEFRRSMKQLAFAN